jgi:hypothetical protein
MIPDVRKVLDFYRTATTKTPWSGLSGGRLSMIPGVSCYLERALAQPVSPLIK